MVRLRINFKIKLTIQAKRAYYGVSDVSSRTTKSAKMLN
jgi:hypothetical protein